MKNLVESTRPILFFIALLISQNIAAATPTKIAWWNIGNDSPTPESLKQIKEGLLALEKDKADIILLGEYVPKSHDPLITGLSATYSFRKFTPYNNSKSAWRGIMMLSKIKDTTLIEGSTDWTIKGSTLKEKEKYRADWYAKNPNNKSQIDAFDRPYLELNLKINGQELRVVPVDLVMPWLMLKKSLGKVGMGLCMAYGDENPLYNQASSIIDLMKVNEKTNSAGLVAIGDFNVPSKVPYTNLKPEAIDLMDNSLTRVPLNAVTFPSQKLTLDHAFVNSKITVQSSKVMPLKGSDHYPIIISVIVKKP